MRPRAHDPSSSRSSTTEPHSNTRKNTKTAAANAPTTISAYFFFAVSMFISQVPLPEPHPATARGRLTGAPNNPKDKPTTRENRPPSKTHQNKSAPLRTPHKIARTKATRKRGKNMPRGPLQYLTVTEC